MGPGEKTLAEITSATVWYCQEKLANWLLKECSISANDRLRGVVNGSPMRDAVVLDMYWIRQEFISYLQHHARVVGIPQTLPVNTLALRKGRPPP